MEEKLNQTKFLDVECTSAITTPNKSVANIYLKAVNGLIKNQDKWVVFNTKDQDAFRAPAASVLDEDEISALLDASDEEFDLLYPEHQPWTTLLVDPEINPLSKKEIPIMFHIFPPSTSKQFPHWDSFGCSHESEVGTFRLMAHVLMITSGYLPKLFSVPFFLLLFFSDFSFLIFNFCVSGCQHFMTM